MASHTIGILAVTGIVSLLSPGTQASTLVYTQAPNTSLVAPSAIKNLPQDPGFTWSYNTDEELWAYFNVASDISFDRISWYGSDADGEFAVDFYSATCGSCGINWVNTDGHFTHDGVYSLGLLPDPGPFSQAQVHKALVSGNLYSYYIDLTTPITLDHNSPYFALSVVNNYSALPFQWAGSDTGPGSHYRYIRGNPVVQSAPGNLAFTLTSTSTVPLPAAAWLLGSGLALLTGVARKRKAA